MLETGHSFRGQQRREGNAAADALAERHDIGRDVGVLIVEELAGTADAGLYFVDDKQQAVRFGQFTQIA